MYTGITSCRKGRIRVYYKGQPYLCGRCNTVHESQCPKRKEELIKEAEEKLDQSLKTKTLVVNINYKPGHFNRIATLRGL